MNSRICYLLWFAAVSSLLLQSGSAFVFKICPNRNILQRLPPFSSDNLIQIHMASSSSDSDRMKTFEVEKRPWGGDRNILKRKKQIPMREYGPKDVIRICLLALQSNDDPQLDHGASVVLEFKSANGLLSQGKLDPAEYGRFLRSTEPYSALLDFKSASLVGDIEIIGNNPESVRQCVCLKSYLDTPDRDTYFDFMLSRSTETLMWYVDVILHRGGAIAA